MRKPLTDEQRLAQAITRMTEALQEIRELREALRRIERKAFNALLQPMRALEEIEAIAHKTLGGEHDCVRLG